MARSVPNSDSAALVDELANLPVLAEHARHPVRTCLYSTGTPELVGSNPDCLGQNRSPSPNLLCGCVDRRSMYSGFRLRLLLRRKSEAFFGRSGDNVVAAEDSESSSVPLLGVPADLRQSGSLRAPVFRGGTNVRWIWRRIPPGYTSPPVLHRDSPLLGGQLSERDEFCGECCTIGVFRSSVSGLRASAVDTLSRHIPLFVEFGVPTTGAPRRPFKMTSDECCELAMTFGGALIRGPRNATTTISVQSRSFERHLCTFCKGFRLQIDRSAFFVKM
jgi:hypothetical protein